MEKASLNRKARPTQAGGRPGGVAKSCVAGIHGGSTKSTGLLTSATGEIYELWSEEKGMNWRETGEDNPPTVLEDFYHHLIHDDQSTGRTRYICDRLALAIAGLFCDVDQSQLRSSVAETRWAAVESFVITDARATLLAGAGQDSGVVVMAGSTAQVYGRTPSGSECLVGGGGSLIGNEGSGFYIAREALNAVLRGRDGRLSQQNHALEWYIQDQLDCPDFESVLTWINVVREKGSLLELADIAPAVTRAAETHQDPVAQAILHKAADELLADFDAARQRLDFKEERIPVVIEGGVIENCRTISEILIHEIPQHEPRAVVSFPRYRAVVGALLLALSDGAQLPDKCILGGLAHSARALPADQLSLVMGTEV